MSLKLYFAPGACSLASHIALEESALPYETERLNLQQGDQRKPEYLKLNPRGRVPTLVADGKVLTENVAIMTLIGGGYCAGRLWPESTWEQARALSLMAWLSNTVHPTFGHILRTSRYVDEQSAQQAVKAKARTMYEDYLREIDGLLQGRRWTIGNHFTVVDGYLVVFYRWGNRLGIPMKAMKNYTRHAEEAHGRPAVARVMADEGITLEA